MSGYLRDCPAAILGPSRDLRHKEWYTTDTVFFVFYHIMVQYSLPVLGYIFKRLPAMIMCNVICGLKHCRQFLQVTGASRQLPVGRFLYCNFFLNFFLLFFLVHSFQRFTNEDHLAVHKHKHEMTLKFGPARTDSVIIAGTFCLRQMLCFTSSLSILNQHSTDVDLEYFDV